LHKFYDCANGLLEFYELHKTLTVGSYNPGAESLQRGTDWVLMWHRYVSSLRGCCCWWSGPGAKAPVALQQLGLLYTLFSRSCHCRRQISPRSTRCERSEQREVELQWARKSSREFCLNADFHVTLRVLLHAANLRHGTAGFTSPPKECVLGIFSHWKIRRLRPGLNQLKDSSWVKNIIKWNVNFCMTLQAVWVAWRPANTHNAVLTDAHTFSQN
jgi:hypothetical protein